MDHSTPAPTRKEWARREQGKHFCECECGTPIPIKKWHHSTGIPQFIRGHMPESNRFNRNPAASEVRECACGCGEEVKGYKDGNPIRFRHGHWARTEQPMKRPEVAAKFRGENNHRWQPIGTRRIQKRMRGSHYIEVKCPDGEWRLEHRWVMEQAIGRPPRADEHVHHINHDTYDNRLENLQLLSHSEHSKLHCVFPAINAARKGKKREEW